MEIGKKSHILFLADVFPDDCLDDETILKTLDVSRDSESDTDQELPDICDSTEFTLVDKSVLEPPKYWAEEICMEYECLPDYFVNLETWPKSSNLLCWSCDTSFKGIPWTVPISKTIKNETFVDDSTPEIYGTTADPINPKIREYYAFQTLGCFCSEFCAQKYINRSGDMRIKNKWESGKLLLEIYRLITGRHIRYIPESEDKYIMMQYCGKKGISIAEYKERNETKRSITY